MPNLQKRYQDVLDAKGWHADENQQQAVDELQRLLKDLNTTKSFWPFSKRKDIKGVYLYGGVGRGKSMLMDLFFDEASDELNKSITKRRTHFHEFLIETHDWLHQHRGDGMDDLLPRYAKHVSTNARLLCFDEFHVTDVADAMILGRLFTELFAHGVVIVATSNWAPDNLYEGGLTRDRFLPFIALLKQETNVLHLDSDTDYRSIAPESQDVYYLCPLNAETKNKVDGLFSQMSEDADIEVNNLKVKGRTIPIDAAGDIARVTFAELCEKPYGAEDYIKIASTFDTVFLTQVPKLTYDRRNEAKRLILLIDCLYEAKCRLIISAQCDVHKLYSGHDHAFEFDRTISRLMEMQSKQYHQSRLKV